MIEWLLIVVDIVSWILLIIGSICVLIGGIGVLRMPDFYSRIHAASLTDTMATLALFSGMILQAGFSLAAAKLFAIMLFLLLTGPTATYALANSALLSGHKPKAAVLEKKVE
ncbi:MAG: monovalent cation/H(+) antiporter subunit G [Pseudomonadales bacterium]|nr:monovalent cation/H(+) antiporter subunit G [Pseudomonadales bacterium]MDG1443025.1 monovalent cation/H(+) antiporter subunit G [Pseudomonadales bacterium]